MAGTALIDNTLMLALAAAPWLVLGLLVAGLVRAWLPSSRLSRQLGDGDVRSVGAAALVGAPLPLCSCGVLPAAFGLRRAGASRPATVSFLIATPETGVDSIAISYVLLGPIFAVVRPLVALATALTTGLAVARLTPEARSAPAVGPAPDLFAEEAGEGECCAAAAATAAPTPGFVGRTLGGLRYAFGQLLDDLAGWLAVGIVVAGLVVTLVPPNLLAAWGQGPLAMLAVLAVSVPMYVCATASTPLALALLHAGVSPGTALVFLLAGPATNFAGMALIRRELGTRCMLVYLSGIAIVSLVAGLALDAAWPALGGDATVPLARGGIDEATPLWLALPALIVLLGFAVRPVRRLLLGGLQRLAASPG